MAKSNIYQSQVRLYMKGCKRGIVVFEDIDEREYNPNVSLELGYMFALEKRCLLLKEERMPNLPTDVCGYLYKNFDHMNIEETISAQIREWVEKDLGITTLNEEDKTIIENANLLSYPNNDIKIMAIEILSNIRNEKANKEILIALQDDEKDIRFLALQRLCENESMYAIDPQINNLSHSDAWYRGFAIRYLGEHGDEKIIPKLEKLVNDTAIIESDNPDKSTLTLGDLAAEAIQKIKKQSE